MTQHHRTNWREVVRAALIEAGATLEQLTTGATVVRTAYEMHRVSDLADIGRSALFTLLLRAVGAGQ
jgi:hypothetical protein